MVRISPRIEWWILPPVLLLAAVLRFGALTSRGFVYWDEGKFALEGVRLLSVMQALPAVHTTSLAGKAIGTAKPTHALLIALSYVLLGVHDYSPLLLDATCSVAAIVVLFLLARRMFGGWVALVAAALLAVSGYDIVYARSALSESDADLLFLIGILLWWRTVGGTNPSIRRRAVAYLFVGLFMGMAFTTNYRLIVFIATLAGVELIRIARQPGWRSWAVPLLLAAGGFLLVPALWQTIGMVASVHGIILFRGEVTYRPSSYLSEMMYQLHGGKQAVLRFQPMRYGEWYVVRQGWPASILLVVGLIVAVFERSLRTSVCAALVVVPYIAYTFAPFIVPRNLDAALPFAAILAALGLVRLVQRCIPSRLDLRTLAVATLVLMAFSTVRDWSVVGLRSGFAQASVYLARTHNPGALAVNEIMRFYLRDNGRGCDAPRLPSTPSGLLMAERSGNEFAVIDHYYRNVERYLARHARLVVRYPVASQSPFGENLIGSENGDSPFLRHTPYVDVYALQSLHGRLPGRLVHTSCTLDQLS